MSMQAVGAYVQAKRKQKGLTQEAAAIELRVSSQTISEWERGKFTPGSDVLARLVAMVDGDPLVVQALMVDPTKTAADGQRAAVAGVVAARDVDTAPAAADDLTEGLSIEDAELIRDLVDGMKLSTQVRGLLQAARAVALMVLGRRGEAKRRGEGQ